MTESQRQLISSLKTNTAYLALVSHLDDEVAGILAGLEEAETPQEIMRLTRVWQIARKIVSRMKILPEAMSEVIAEEIGKPSLETLLGPDEDPFLRPSRPVPPPYQENL